MQAAQQNPFNKPNPFKYGHYQKFQHAHLPTSSALNTSYLGNETKCYQLSSTSKNSWGFNSNNLGKKVDLSRGVENRESRVSDFEVKMRVSSVYTTPNDRSKPVEIKDSKLQNPFMRKNLIVNREEVNNQVQIDMTKYRHKAKSFYEESRHVHTEYADKKGMDEGIRVSFGNIPTQNPYLARKESRSSYLENKSNPYDRKSVTFESKPNPYESKPNPYESKPNPYENKPNIYENNIYDSKTNPYDQAMVISQYVRQSERSSNPYEKESLAYSKTPVQTKRNPQQDAPSSITFNHRRFFLAPVIQQP